VIGYNRLDSTRSTKGISIYKDHGGATAILASLTVVRDIIMEYMCSTTE
jgi:hypothetical protein